MLTTAHDRSTKGESTQSALAHVRSFFWQALTTAREELELAQALSISLAEDEARRGSPARSHHASDDHADSDGDDLWSACRLSERMSEASASEEWSLCSPVDAEVDDDEWQAI